MSESCPTCPVVGVYTLRKSAHATSSACAHMLCSPNSEAQKLGEEPTNCFRPQIDRLTLRRCATRKASCSPVFGTSLQNRANLQLNRTWSMYGTHWQMYIFVYDILYFLTWWGDQEKSISLFLINVWYDRFVICIRDLRVFCSRFDLDRLST